MGRFTRASGLPLRACLMACPCRVIRSMDTSALTDVIIIAYHVISPIERVDPFAGIDRPGLYVIAAVDAGGEDGVVAAMNDDLLREAARALGRRGAASRRIVERTCAVCGVPIQGIMKRRYCSNTCAVRAHRERRRQQGAGTDD